MLFTLKLFIWFSCHWILPEEYIYIYFFFFFFFFFFWLTRIGFLATIPHFGLLSGKYGKRLFQPWFVLIVHWKYCQLKLRLLVCIFCNKWHVLHQVTYRIPSWHLKVTTIPWFDDLKFLRLWKWAWFTNTTSLFFLFSGICLVQEMVQYPVLTMKRKLLILVGLWYVVVGVFLFADSEVFAIMQDIKGGSLYWSFCL